MGGHCSQKLLLRRGSHSSPGRSRSSDQYEINNSIAKIGSPATSSLRRSLFFRQRRRGCDSCRPVTIVSLETSLGRLVPSHRYSLSAAWSPLARQNGSLLGRR